MFDRGHFLQHLLHRAATGGTVGIVRSAGLVVRDLQSGMLRSYAVLMAFGIVAIVLYFLIRSI